MFRREQHLHWIFLAKAMPCAQLLVEHCDTRGIPMALVTSSSLEAVTFKAEPHPWLKRIHERVYGDDPELQAGKPDPAPFRLAASRLGMDPRRCWALEDSQAGTEAALAAGCMVWVLNEQPTSHDLNVNPRQINSLGVVLDLLLSTAG